MGMTTGPQPLIPPPHDPVGLCSVDKTDEDAWQNRYPANWCMNDASHWRLIDGLWMSVCQAHRRRDAEQARMYMYKTDLGSWALRARAVPGVADAFTDRLLLVAASQQTLIDGAIQRGML